MHRNARLLPPQEQSDKNADSSANAPGTESSSALHTAPASGHVKQPDDDASVTTSATGSAAYSGDQDARLKRYISDLLLNAIDVRVGWDDIVECMRGVINEMRDMEKSIELEHHSMTHANSESPTTQVATIRSASQLHLRRLRSASAAKESGSEGPGSHLTLVPEFNELDSKLLAKTNVQNDGLYYAANLCNVLKQGEGMNTQHQQSLEKVEKKMKITKDINKNLQQRQKFVPNYHVHDERQSRRCGSAAGCRSIYHAQADKVEHFIAIFCDSG